MNELDYRQFLIRKINRVIFTKLSFSISKLKKEKIGITNTNHYCEPCYIKLGYNEFTVSYRYVSFPKICWNCEKSLMFVITSQYHFDIIFDKYLKDILHKKEFTEKEYLYMYCILNQNQLGYQVSDKFIGLIGQKLLPNLKDLFILLL